MFGEVIFKTRREASKWMDIIENNNFVFNIRCNIENGMYVVTWEEEEWDGIEE